MPNKELPMPASRYPTKSAKCGYRLRRTEFIPFPDCDQRNEFRSTHNLRIPHSTFFDLRFLLLVPLFVAICAELLIPQTLRAQDDPFAQPPKSNTKPPVANAPG